MSSTIISLVPGTTGSTSVGPNLEYDGLAPAGRAGIGAPTGWFGNPRWYATAIVAVLTAAVAACGGNRPVEPGKRDMTALVAALQTEGAEADSIPVLGPADPPPVGSYPSAPGRIEGWINNQQMDSIRAHGWSVWASITSRARYSRLPVWETWYSGSEVYPADPTAPPAAAQPATRHPVRDFEDPRQFHHLARMNLPRGEQIPINRHEAVTSFNRYSRTLAEYVWNHHYNNADTLNAINAGWSPGTPIAQRQIVLSADSVDPSEIALKPVFQFISGDSASAIPYWAGDTITATDSLANPMPDPWRQGVVVDPTRKLRPGTKVWMSVNGHPPDSLVVVSLNTFYHIRLTRADSASYSAFAEASGDDVGQGNSGADSSVAAMVRPGNIALLVAMHVTTKEITNWTWQTFWWSPYAADSTQTVGRPPSVRGVWRNYLMNVAYFMVTPPNAQNGTPYIAYNPYLETNLHGTFPTSQGDSVHWTGVTTNCMTCHRMASWGTLSSASGTAQATGAPYENNGQIEPGDSVFSQYTKLDFLWSVTRARLPPAGARGTRGNASRGPDRPGARIVDP